MDALLALLLALPLRPGAGASEVLHEWDRARAAAYSSGEVGTLRELYLPGSAAGRADTRLLARYAERGVRVRGQETQVLALDVIGALPGAYQLRVVDRLVTGDSPSAWRVDLWWHAGRWRVAEVRAQARPAATTASTSRSRNR